MDVIRILASGSSGNAAILSHDDTHLLLDAGISLRRMRQALEQVGLSVDDLAGVVLTHEHSDHTKGLKMLTKYFPETPMWASEGTRRGVSAIAGDWRTLTRGTPVDIGTLTFYPYRAHHDAEEPLGFRIEGRDGTSVGWATDMGRWDEETVEHLAGVQYALIEANHDPDMLRDGPYPAFLKRRVSGIKGHLSNHQARDLLAEIASSSLERVILGHLSEKNNDPDLAARTVRAALVGAEVAVEAAARKTPGAVHALTPPTRYESRVGEAQQALW